MQPLLTALGAGALLGERVRLRPGSGRVLGFIGLALVVSGTLGIRAERGPLLIPAGVAFIGITAETLYQKRFCAGFDRRTGSVIPWIASAFVTAIAIALLTKFQVTWTASFVFALGGRVWVRSMGAISLLNGLIHRGRAVSVARLFYRTPWVSRHVYC